MCSFQCLNARHFIGTDYMNPVGIQGGSVFVQLADLLYLLAELLWIIRLSIEPVTIQMGL